MSLSGWGSGLWGSSGFGGGSLIGPVVIPVIPPPLTPECIAPGWGAGPWGITPWGGSLDGTPGGDIPTLSTFDIYCVGPCGPMSFIATYLEVELNGDPLEFATDPISLDFVMSSGGSVYPTADARLIINTGVPEQFTFDFTIELDHLPPNFTDLVHEHVFLGVSDAQGFSAGIFISKVGLAYTGSVHHLGGALDDQDLVLDNVVFPLADSQLLVEEGDYFSFRIAVDGITGTTYLFCTRTSELPTLGLQLRYVLPAISSSTSAQVPPDRTLVSVRGTVGNLSQISIDSICLGTGLIIPNLPPVADAGSDQASRSCEIIRLNGEKSFDPEGGALTYQWRLTDAPLGSMFISDGLDGTTFTTGTGFTNKFYSATLAAYDGSDPIVVGAGGDVVVVAGVAYTITTKGTDGHGFYVQIGGFDLPDNLAVAPFKLLRQRGLANPTQVLATFFPDLPGFWKFDLTVSDGQLMSEPSVTIVVVSESPQPRGCIPDVSFIWSYLSDFWNLVQDKEPIDVFWSSLAQVAAAEMLSLWQIDYSKSLRDVQRTFQRRWLHYDTTLTEPFPDTATLHYLLSGVQQLFPVAGLPGIPGTTLTVVVPGLAKRATLTFSSSGTLTAGDVLDQLLPFLQNLDPRFAVTITSNRVPPGSTANQYLFFSAPFAFSIDASSTAPIFVGASSGMPQGTAGAGVGVQTYQVEIPIGSIGIQKGDLLQVDGICYQITRVVDNKQTEWPFQQLILSDSLPPNVGSNWSLPGRVTSKFVDFYGALVWKNDLVDFEVFDQTLRQETKVTVGGAFVVPSAPSSLGVDLTGLTGYLADAQGRYEVLFTGLQRLNYLPIDPLVQDIPLLQAVIKNPAESSLLRRNLDFFIDTYRDKTCIRFVFDSFGGDFDIWQDPATVPQQLWAEVTYLDNRPTIESNFGIPAEFTLDDLSELPSTTDYLSTVRGLWYAYFNGPTLFNLRAGAQILLGLPFAEEMGIITEIRADFSPTTGRILVQDVASTATIRSYTYPLPLLVEINPATGQLYKVGDTVQQFAPLVTGVEIDDWVKDPKWFEGYLNQGSFFEVEKFFKFLVRVDSTAFSLQTLLFAKSFILRIKPTYTYPLFVVRRTVQDTEVNTTDLITYVGHLYLYDGACTNGMLGSSTMWDEPDAARGGWRSQYDAGPDPAVPPIYPNPDPVKWGFDKDLLCPEDYVDATVCIAWAGGVPTFDSIFAFDQTIDQAGAYHFGKTWVMDIPDDGVGLQLLDAEVTVTANATLTGADLIIQGDPGPGATDYVVILYKNGTTAHITAFTAMPITTIVHVTATISVSIGDTLSAQIQTDFGGARTPVWESVSLSIGQTVVWAYDTSLAAGSYCLYKSLS